MILLTSTSDKIQIVTGQAITVDVHASWVDNAAGTITPGRTNTAISTATTTDVVAAPAASTQRNVQKLIARNRGASGVDVTVKHTDGTTTPELIKVTLGAGEVLTYEDGQGWRVLDATGAIKQANNGTGRFLKTTVLNAGGTFTTDPATRTMFVRMVGGGGGGGGCTSVASAASAGGGGGAGGYAEKTFSVSGNTGYTTTVGAGGTGVSGAGGNNGGASSITVGATTVTAQAGQGAPVATAVTTLSVYRGGNQSAVSTNGDLNSAGEPGESGVIVVVATPLGTSGRGGSCPMGAGGSGLSAVGNGVAGLGFGAGGGGAMTGASVARTGGNGTQGAIIIDEYS